MAKAKKDESLNIIEKAPRTYVRPTKKGPVTFNIQLTEEQKEAKRAALANVVTVFIGKPGTSKSTICCHVALDLLIKGEVNKIIITRPTVTASRDIGFLPGDAFDFKEGKMAPYLAPILQSMYKLRSQAEIDNMIKKEQIEVKPIQFVRGLNFENCVVIVDESQNMTVEELKALTTRICYNSKMLFTSDLNQVDLFNKSGSAGHYFKKISQLDEVAIVELTENYRHPLALSILDMLNEE